MSVIEKVNIRPKKQAIRSFLAFWTTISANMRRLQCRVYVAFCQGTPVVVSGKELGSEQFLSYALDAARQLGDAFIGFVMQTSLLL